MVKLRGNNSAMFYGANAKTFDKATELRGNMTITESLLWERLKDKQVLNLKFRRQHPVGQFIVDFYCHKIQLVIEIDGGIHNLKENREYDENRTYELNRFGIKVIRFTNESINSNIDNVVIEIEKVCQELIKKRIYIRD